MEHKEKELIDYQIAAKKKAKDKELLEWCIAMFFVVPIIILFMYLIGK